MKKIVSNLASRKERSGAAKFAFVIGSAAVLAGAANAAIVADFTFESSLTSGGTTTAASVGGLLAEVGLGTASGVHALTNSVYSVPAGNGSVNSFSSNHWSSGDYYQFVIDTTSYQDLLVSFDLTRSSTGPNGFTLQYSVDGTNFTNYTALGSMPGTSWSGASTTVTNTSYSFDLSSIDVLENLSAVYFRVTSDGLNSASAAVATGGTARIDNFLVSGTATAAPEPSSVALATLAGAGAMMVRRRRRAS